MSELAPLQLELKAAVVQVAVCALACLLACVLPCSRAPVRACSLVFWCQAVVTFGRDGVVVIGMLLTGRALFGWGCAAPLPTHPPPQIPPSPDSRNNPPAPLPIPPAPEKTAWHSRYVCSILYLYVYTDTCET